MELLSQYRSSSSSSSESQCESSVDESPLTQQQVRSVYLLTYSQADLSIFPDKESSAPAVCEAVLKRWLPQSENSTVDMPSGETQEGRNALSHGNEAKQNKTVATYSPIFKTEVECQCSLLKSPCELLQRLALHNEGRQRISSVIQSSRFG